MFERGRSYKFKYSLRKKNKIHIHMYENKFILQLVQVIKNDLIIQD